MREKVKLYTHTPLKYFASPILEILTDKMIFIFKEKKFTILYKDLAHYEKFKQYIIMKIKKDVKSDFLSISISPKSSKAQDRIFNQLEIFYNDSISYTDNPLLKK